jgi:hypothetical protein
MYSSGNSSNSDSNIKVVGYNEVSKKTNTSFFYAHILR